MSVRRLPVTLSPRAQRDYEDILLYSLNTWGERQMDAYKAVLDRALAELGDYPMIGPARDDTRTGYRGRRVGQHVIYYRVGASAIRVNRIVHGRRAIESELEHGDDEG